MHLIANDNLSELLLNKYIFLDNDILEKLFKDKEFLPDFINLVSKSYLMIDSFTEFEFYRDIYHPLQQNLREEFLQQDIFYPVTNRGEVLAKIIKNSLILSRIYSLKSQGVGKSTQDLLLAGRMVLGDGKFLLITGNRQHFPPCLFDIIGVFNVEDANSGNVRTFSTLKFNRQNFNNCFEELQKTIEKLTKTAHVVSVNE